MTSLGVYGLVITADVAAGNLLEEKENGGVDDVRRSSNRNANKRILINQDLASNDGNGRRTRGGEQTLVTSDHGSSMSVS